MEMNERTLRYRGVLKFLVYGELGAVIAMMYLFGLYSGCFHLIHVWIDYLAYASASYCAVAIVCITAAMELLMLFMNGSDSARM